MPTRPSSAVLLCGLALLTARPAQSAPPGPDFSYPPSYAAPGFLALLDQSKTPQAAAIRKQLADGPAALAREKAAAQAAGIPLTVSAPSSPSPTQNAAPLWDQWNALRKQDPIVLPLYGQLLSDGYAYTPAQLALVQQQFDGHPTLVSLLHQAADRTSVSYADPAYLHSAGLREAARELRTESILLAHQGRYAEAVTDQARGFNVAKQFASSPGLGEYLTGDAANAITFSGLYAILKMAGPDAGVAAEVRQAVEAARPVLPLKAALLADVPPDVQSLETLRRASPQAFLQMTTDARAAGVPTVAWKAWTPSQRRFLDRLVDATEAQYLSEVRRLVAATETPDLARHRVFAAVQDGRDALPDSPVTQLDPLLSDSRMLARAFGTLDQVDTRARARIAVTLAATALLTTRAQAGAFPDALPGDFPDPSTGKALGYRREGVDGFVVYSVGPDGTFGGGEPGGRDFQVHQVYFRYPGLTPKPVPADMLK